jgi:hypothetical protein
MFLAVASTVMVVVVLIGELDVVISVTMVNALVIVLAVVTVLPKVVVFKMPVMVLAGSKKGTHAVQKKLATAAVVLSHAFEALSSSSQSYAQHKRGAISHSQYPRCQSMPKHK